jgi:hypothetical protein
MDIHKPKPIRNWRELLTEVGTIVLGVSIALAAEQSVEWVHWHQEVAAARTLIAKEIAVNDVYFSRRIAYQPCMSRQIKEAETIINDLEAGRPHGDFTALHTGIEQSYEDSQWQSQRASQVLTHFPSNELTLMTRHYAGMEGLRIWMDHEGFAWADLNVLRGPPAGLTASDFIRLRASLTIARRMNALTITRAQRLLRLSQQLSISPVPVDPEWVQKFCTLSDEAFGAYRRTVEER